MARRPTRSQVATARAAAAEDERPIRFVADYDHVEPEKTVAYKAGMTLQPPAAHRKAALRLGRAVVDGE